MTDIVQLKDGATLLYPKTHVKAVDGLVVPDAYTKTETNNFLVKKQDAITDTGWVKAGNVFKNGSTAYSTEEHVVPSYRIVKIGNLEIVTIRAEFKNVISSLWAVVANFPEVARPLATIPFSMPASGSIMARWSYETNGDLNLNSVNGGSTNKDTCFPVYVQFYRGKI